MELLGTFAVHGETGTMDIRLAGPRFVTARGSVDRLLVGSGSAAADLRPTLQVTYSLPPPHTQRGRGGPQADPPTGDAPGFPVSRT